MYKNKKLIGAIIALSIIRAISMLALLECVTVAIDSVSGEIILALAGIMFIQFITGVFINYCKNQYCIEETIERDACLTRRLNRLRYDYHESKECGDLLATLRTDYEKEAKNISAVGDVTYALVSALAYIFFLIMNTEIRFMTVNLLLFLFCLALTGLVELRMSRCMFGFWEKYIQNTRLYNHYSEVFIKKEYAEERKIFQFGGFFTDKFDAEFDNATRKNRAQGRKRMHMECFSELCVALFLLLQLGMVAAALEGERMSIGAAVALLTYAVSIFSSISTGLYSVPELVRMSALRKKYTAFMGDASIEASRERERCQDPEYAIEMENVSFSYTNGAGEVIDRLTAGFQKGKRYAVVGANGAGKTTLVKLISGLYRADSGHVRVSGRIGVLFQDFNRYPYSMGENIALGLENADMEKAASGLNIPVSDFENGLNTQLLNINEEGIDLSGGQWQKLALARMAVSEADIIILDEPTANLDPVMEAKIYEDYLPMLGNKTVIMITHRLGYLSGFDQILTLAGGKIAESGTHEELMRNKASMYRRMYEKQRTRYE
ncbi:MAG: ABC transporter ATP-binding protein/permease [Roseburia sp.]|nr:ABC transporter ATP-binding protein/permease [Roseburia sp.]